MLWGERSTANKYHWRVWGVFAVYGPHWICPSSRHHVLLGSTLLRLQLVLQGNCLRRALGCVLSPSGSGSRVLHKGVLCPSKVRAAQVPRCLASALSPGGRLRLIASPVPASQFRHLRCAVCLLWGADLWLRPSWRMSTIQNPWMSCLETGSLFAVW